jgi:predicted aspartyl protease
MGALLMCSMFNVSVAASEPQVASAPPVASTPQVAPTPQDDLSEIVIQTPEPRFVAPTHRDQIGRIWAPVVINGKGPFRLVLDTGANHSGVTAVVADVLGIPLGLSPPVRLRGVTGIVMVPAIHVDTFDVGDLTLGPATLPIVTDALGGAQGVLATNDFRDERILIDFKHDRIDIRRSRNERTPADFITIPWERSDTGLLMFHTHVGGMRVLAIVDTGGQRTIGNLAMRDALVRRRIQGQPVQIFDVTAQSQSGEFLPCPPIDLGPLKILGAHIAYGEIQVFEHWHIDQEPALLLGMDVIGLLDTFIIDYRRHELHLRMRE